MNKSTQTHFTIKTCSNRATKDDLLENGAKLLRVVGKNKSQRYSMVTDNIDIIPNDAHIIVRRSQWECVVSNFSEINAPIKVYNEDGTDFHYEYPKHELAPVSGKIFKKVVLSK